MGRLKSIVGAAVLLGASLMVSLGAAEMCLRLFPQLMPEEAQLRLHWRSINNPVTKADPYLGYRYPANYEGRFERDGGSFSFSYRTDEHGFRNPSPWPERADIVVVGDSMAFGYGVEDDETWTALMADQLPGTRIINLGLVGAAPQQYQRAFELFGQALRPELVLFCLFPGNDLLGAGHFDQWLKAGAQGDVRLWRPTPETKGVMAGLRRMLERSYLATFYRYARKSARSQFGARTIDFSDGGQLQLVPTSYAEKERQANPNHPNFRLVLDAVEQTRALAERNGSAFLVLVLPSKVDVYLPLLDDDARSPAISSFVAQFEEAGIPYFDLTPHLQAAARQGERLFFKVDGHPNAIGYRLIADLVVDHLRRHSSSYRLTKVGLMSSRGFLERRQSLLNAGSSTPARRSTYRHRRFAALQRQ